MSTIIDEQRAFLRQICHTPYDDVPRLVYADWLQERAGTLICLECEGYGHIRPWVTASDDVDYSCKQCHGTGHISNGYAEQAELIRVQIKLANLPKSARTIPTCGGYYCDVEQDGYESHRHCDYDNLLQREQELVKQIQPSHSWGISTIVCHTDQIVPWHTGGSDVAYIIYRRGFPNSVNCSFADWRCNAHAILAEHPIRKVTLTTSPSIGDFVKVLNSATAEELANAEASMLTSENQEDITEWLQHYWPGPPDDNGILQPAVGPNGEPEPIEYVLDEEHTND